MRYSLLDTREAATCCSGNDSNMNAKGVSCIADSSTYCSISCSAWVSRAKDVVCNLEFCSRFSGDPLASVPYKTGVAARALAL